MADTISKAELARELDLSRARISQLCKLGLPVRLDGKLNRSEARAWVAANIDPAGGGWLGGLRPKPTRLRQEPIQESSTKCGMESADPSAYGELVRLEIPQREGEIREQAAIDFMNDVRQTGNIENFARMALRFGCTMQQAYAVAQWFDLFMAFYFVPQKPERAYIRAYEEPDWSGIAAEVATTAEVESWRDWMNRLLEAEIPRKSEE